MVDYVALLKKTIDGLPSNDEAIRERVYAKARQTVESKLAAISPAPPQAALDKQRGALETAIGEVEASYAPPPPPEPEPEPADDPLDNVLDDLMSVADEKVDYEAAEASAPALNVAPEPELAAPTLVAPKAPQPDIMGLQDPTPLPDGPSLSERAADLVTDGGDKASAAIDRVSDSASGLAGATIAAPQRVKEKASSGKSKGLFVGLLGLLVIGGIGYGVWSQKDMIAETTGIVLPGAKAPMETPTPAPEPEVAVTPEPEPQTTEVEPEAPSETPSGKFTQRLLPNGEEVETGPVPSATGSESSQAATTPSEPLSENAEAEGTEAPEAPAAENEPESSIAVGQSAIFYEEQTGASTGTALRGFVVWDQDSEPQGDGQPPESIIRGELSIPEKELNVRLSIRRNLDQTLPASHIVEMIVQTPEGFAGGGIDEVQRITMKATEQAAGQALIGAPVKIAEGFFLIALDDSAAALAANTQALQQGNWMDIPVVYKTGRRALLSFEKGIPGEKIFNDVFEEWGSN